MFFSFPVVLSLVALDSFPTHDPTIASTDLLDLRFTETAIVLSLAVSYQRCRQALIRP